MRNYFRASMALLLAMISTVGSAGAPYNGSAPHTVDARVEKSSNLNNMSESSALGASIQFTNRLSIPTLLTYKAELSELPEGVQLILESNSVAISPKGEQQLEVAATFTASGKFTIPLVFAIQGNKDAQGKANLGLIRVHIYAEVSDVGGPVGLTAEMKTLDELYPPREVMDMHSGPFAEPADETIPVTAPLGDGSDLPLPPEVPDVEEENGVDSKTTVAPGTIRGQLFWQEGSFRRGAWAWIVRIWQRLPGATTWRLVGARYVGGNGAWQVPYNYIFNADVLVEYTTSNRYFELKNSRNQAYRWFERPFTTTSSVNTVANRVIVLGGATGGLGYVHEDGIRSWVTLAYADIPVNPLRSSPIQITYPNTSFNCGGSRPWSCASTSGRIWLIPQHAYLRYVTVHELGHQLHYQFWNNRRPPNSGGSHTLTGCFTPGLALTEGFANFFSFFVLTNHRTNSPLNAFNVEDPSTFGACTTKGRNESWVAATFWDLTDIPNDGLDVFYFPKKTRALHTFLTGGYQTNMAPYRNIYANGQTLLNRVRIWNIFNQNNN
ncbi:MAG: hypothetical protein OXT67_04830 [Zetaproteobacteria bacterium]|nr:hypothetical protein [Zetaproteobacteria bacterium]